MNVYIIVAGPYCKIGMALDVKRRIAGFSAGIPIPFRVAYSVPVPPKLGYKVEKKAHKLLERRRSRSEWFQVNEETARAVVDEAVRSVVARHPKQAKMEFVFPRRRGGRSSPLHNPAERRRVFELWCSDITSDQFRASAGISARTAREHFGPRPSMPGRPKGVKL